MCIPGIPWFRANHCGIGAVPGTIIESTRGEEGTGRTDNIRRRRKVVAAEIVATGARTAIL